MSHPWDWLPQLSQVDFLLVNWLLVKNGSWSLTINDSFGNFYPFYQKKKGVLYILNGKCNVTLKKFKVVTGLRVYNIGKTIRSIIFFFVTSYSSTDVGNTSLF